MPDKEHGKHMSMMQAWAEEDQRLQSLSDELRKWMAIQPVEPAELNEARQRWIEYRQTLCEHFDNEDRALATLNTPEVFEEVSAVRRQSMRDHTHLLTRIDRIMTQLANLQTTSQWQELQIASNLLFDAVEQHEEQEWDSLSILVSSVSC